MKKMLLSTIIFTALIASSKAQTGSVLLNGDFGLSLSKDYQDDKTTIFSFNPGVGYQFNNAWTVGLGMGYTQSTYSYGAYDPGSTTRNYSVGPFIRYSKALSSIFSIYGQFNANYTFFNGTGEANGSGFATQIFPALFVNVKNGFGLNFSFGGIHYLTSSQKGVGSSNHDFEIDFGQTVNFGISKNFGGKSRPK